MSTQPFIEVEAKFAVDDSIAVPDLTALSAVESAGETVNHSLSAIYYDTADLRLTRAKVTLRRRTGGKDDGWHIKLPGTTGRTELHAELTDPSTPPATRSPNSATTTSPPGPCCPAASRPRGANGKSNYPASSPRPSTATRFCTRPPRC